MTNLAERVDAVVEIDTHRDTHEAEIANAAGTAIATVQISNDSAGFAALLTWIAEHAPGPRIAISLEGTRSCARHHVTTDPLLRRTMQQLVAFVVGDGPDLHACHHLASPGGSQDQTRTESGEPDYQPSTYRGVSLKGQTLPAAALALGAGAAGGAFAVGGASSPY